ncbi:MAG TPA: hypothetical protein VF520_16780 [Thermoleophilaceae bacterium]|jgi:hypothetical protein
MRLRPVPALAAAVLLAAPSQAAALIQVDQGIGGARIGNSQKEVKTALGDPDLVKTGSNDFGAFTQFYYAGGLRIFFQGDKEVTSATTVGTGDRTAKGIGVGSTEKSVKKKVPGVKCETSVGVRSCHTNEFEPGQRVTDFVLKSGRVVRVTVGIVVD